MKKRILVPAIAACSIFLLPAVGFAVPVPVIDLTAEPVWVKTLAQGVYAGENLHQMVNLEIQNALPTVAGWSQNAHTPVTTETILNQAITTVDGYDRQIQANTGAPPLADPAYEAAKEGMSGIADDQRDLDAAKAASDSAQGALSAQQASDRFQELAIINATKERQFEYARYIKQKQDEQAEIAWLTGRAQVTATSSDAASQDEAGMQ